MYRRSIIAACRHLNRSSLVSSRPRLVETSVPASRQWQPLRTYAAKSDADIKIEHIQELYATAKDEFELAVEETEKKTIYAADDRAAAQEEFQKLKDAFDTAVKESDPSVGEEISRRVGQRIRELDHALQGLEQSAMED